MQKKARDVIRTARKKKLARVLWLTFPLPVQSSWNIDYECDVQILKLHKLKYFKGQNNDSTLRKNCDVMSSYDGPEGSLCTSSIYSVRTSQRPGRTSQILLSVSTSQGSVCNSQKSTLL